MNMRRCATASLCNYAVVRLCNHKIERSCFVVAMQSYRKFCNRATVRPQNRIILNIFNNESPCPCPCLLVTSVLSLTQKTIIYHKYDIPDSV